MAVSITDCCGNMLEIKPEQKEIDYLNKELNADLEEITKVVAVEDPDSLPGKLTCTIIFKDSIVTVIDSTLMDATSQG